MREKKRVVSDYFWNVKAPEQVYRDHTNGESNPLIAIFHLSCLEFLSQNYVLLCSFIMIQEVLASGVRITFQPSISFEETCCKVQFTLPVVGTPAL